MKVKEEFTWERKKKRRGRRRKRRREREVEKEVKKATKNELEATEDVAHKQGNNELENTDVAAQNGAH